MTSRKRSTRSKTTTSKNKKSRLYSELGGVLEDVLKEGGLEDDLSGPFIGMGFIIENIMEFLLCFC